MVFWLMASAGAQAHPDLTGVWMAPFRLHPTGTPIMGGQTTWIPVSQGDPKDVTLPSLDQIEAAMDAARKQNILAVRHPDPFNRGDAPLPMTAAGYAAAAALDHKKLEQQRVDCYPSNVFIRLPGSPVQIVQNRQAIALISEFGPARTIHMDGRSNADAIPQWNGHSVGHWDGDTLKIETVAIRGGIFNWDDPMSDSAKVYEELSLSRDGKRLIDRITYDDPAFYREKLRKMVYLDRRPDLEVLDYQCGEGKEDMIETVSKTGAAK